MNAMNLAATATVQAKEPIVSQERIFDAIETIILEKTNKGIIPREETTDDEVITSLTKRNCAIYLAEGLLAYITPLFDEVIKISCSKSKRNIGQVFYVPQE